MVTFLYRAAGSPKAARTESGFADIPADGALERAVQSVEEPSLLLSADRVPRQTEAAAGSEENEEPLRYSAEKGVPFG